MDEQTKHIVAAILTAGYCANRPSTEGGGFRPVHDPAGHDALTTEQIVAAYREFLSELEGPGGGSSQSPKGT